MFIFFTVSFTLQWINFFLTSSVEACCYGIKPPCVPLSTGCVEGITRTSVLGRPYYSFQGIPYASPPLGALRFKAPKPPVKWSGVLSANKESPACLQPKRTNLFPISFSEDCLFINVFTPRLQQQKEKLLPVMVWIHGGKFYQSSSSVYKYGPDFLLTKDVVLVTFNYRLGIFGYLNMNISEAQGNAAMKDKIAALRWVKKEIHKFGGDPTLVTIFGGSSGASAVNLLYLSPMASGLFERAISHSGSSLCSWSFLPSTVHLGLQVAQSLGCSSHSARAAVSCLRDINGSILAEQQMILKGVEGLENPFLPSIETKQGEEVFLSDSPKNIMTKASSIPYIIGINNREGLMYVEDPYKNPHQFCNLEENLISYLPVYMLKNISPDVAEVITQRIKEFYFKDRCSLNNTIYGFVDYMTDRQFTYCILKTVEALSIQAPMYFYYFTFEGEFQPKNHAYHSYNLTGVCHGDELGYFFYRNHTIPEQNNFSAYPADMAVVNKMITLWTNFAIHGNPTPLKDDQHITWKTAEGSVTKHLIVGDTLEMAEEPLWKEREVFWDDLYIFLSQNLTASRKTHFIMNTAMFLLILTVLVLGIVYFFKIKQWIKYQVLF